MNTNLVRWFLCALLLCGKAGAVTDLDALKTALETALSGKFLLLRGFPTDNRLEFDSQLRPVKPFHLGSWTMADMEITEVGVDGNNLILSGERIAFARNNGFFRGLVKVRLDKVNRKDRKIEIKLRGPYNQAPEDFVRQVKEIVFIKDLGLLDKEVPVYWVNFLKKNPPDQSGGSIELLSHLKTIDALGSAHSKEEQELELTSDLSPEEQTYKVGEDNVLPPKNIYSPDPDYGEIANKPKASGTVRLKLIVTSTGQVGRIWIDLPVGLGLDEEAVASVQKWRFKPATKDGKPVQVPIYVEMGFHR